ncbi:MAG TPA: hypothetical protein VLI93_10145, partial [Acetobacteraceae bacterium]|nr:hypothetical protein [Acetobacteraceae bacterium]
MRKTRSLIIQVPFAGDAVTFPMLAVGHATAASRHATNHRLPIPVIIADIPVGFWCNVHGEAKPNRVSGCYKDTVANIMPLAGVRQSTTSVQACGHWG